MPVEITFDPPLEIEEHKMYQNSSYSCTFTFTAPTTYARFQKAVENMALTLDNRPHSPRSQASFSFADYVKGEGISKYIQDESGEIFRVEKKFPCTIKEHHQFLLAIQRFARDFDKEMAPAERNPAEREPGCLTILSSAFCCCFWSAPKTNINSQPQRGYDSTKTTINPLLRAGSAERNLQEQAEKRDSSPASHSDPSAANSEREEAKRTLRAMSSRRSTSAYETADAAMLAAARQKEEEMRARSRAATAEREAYMGTEPRIDSPPFLAQVAAVAASMQKSTANSVRDTQPAQPVPRM